jgi:hypothetical protein
MRRFPFALLPLALAVVLAGCDQLGIEAASAVAARREAEGKAIGAGCRHAARSVEQCFVMNKRADKAAVFTGWREMNDYMRENKIEAQPAPAEAQAAADEPSDAEPETAKVAKAEKPDKAGKAPAKH